VEELGVELLPLLGKNNTTKLDWQNKYPLVNISAHFRTFSVQEEYYGNEKRKENN
jgi:hypothetical protein